MKKAFLFFVLLTFVLSCTMTKNESQNNGIFNTAATTAFPKYVDYVSDFENVFTAEETEALVKVLKDYESRTTNEIAVISISENLSKETFDQYALDLSNHWGIGTPEKNNGLTIVFSKKLRKIRICTGTGTEKVLTDQMCNDVLNKKILPKFRTEDYYSGITNGVHEFIRLWK